MSDKKHFVQNPFINSGLVHFSGSLDYKVCAKFAQVVDNTINYSTQIHFAFQNYNQGQEAECKTSLQNNLEVSNGHFLGAMGWDVFFPRELLASMDFRWFRHPLTITINYFFTY